MNELLLWFAENWFMLVVGFSALCIAGISIFNFLRVPREGQLDKVREWLLQAVIEAEKQLGEKTGKVKLSFCYDRFVARFPAVASFISFETFSLLVDEALEKMKKMLENNQNLQEYIYGNKKEEQ